MEKIRRYTKEQIEYRNTILRKKPKSKQAKIIPEPIITPRSTYMRNCLYWIDSYEKGECTKQRMYEVLKHLERYTNDYIIEIIKST